MAAKGACILLVTTLIATFLCGEVMLQSTSIDDYQEPTDCDAFEVLNRTGVSLKCQMPVINYSVNGANFSVISSDYTLALDMICTTDPRLAPHLESSFDNVSLSHLKELQVLAFVNCDFRVLPPATSNTFPSTLTYLGFERKYRYVEDQRGSVAFAPSLEVKAGALSTLTQLSTLEILYFNVVTLPPNELCHAPDLLGLNLSYNLLDDLKVLGFSGSADRVSSCGEKLITLDVSFNKLSAIRNASLSNLISLQLLYLEGNGIMELGVEAFANMFSLLGLDLSRNRLSSFPPNVWRDTGELFILNASHNLLSSELNEDTFKNLNKLATLDLGDNLIETVSPNAFNHLIGLTELFLLSNRIRTIGDATFKSLLSLTLLDLSDNLIENLTSTSLSGLRTLNFLHAKNNGLLRTIDDNAFSECPRLVILSLSNTSLTAVPKLTQLMDLQVLDLSRNNIANIYNESFSELSQLIRVNLKSNKIQQIDEHSFANNVQLEFLDLSQNNLFLIPHNLFKENIKLFNLDLSRNYLRFTVNLQTNAQMNYLNLSVNQITKLDYGLFPKGLSVLDVSHNRLTSIEEKFNAAKEVQLTYMDASFNQLQRITNSMLPKTPKMILLSNNKVSDVQTGAFADMPYLMYVDLSFNALRTLPMDALLVQKTPTLNRPKFFFEGNTFDCDCTMKWLKTINNDHHRRSTLKMYGLVYDLPFLYCWIAAFQKDVQRTVSLVTATADDRFLCAFRENTFADALCYRRIPHRTICTIVCPDACKCYRDSSWAIVTVRCTRANITRVPSNIPTSVTSLYVDGNAIRQLSNESIGSLPTLKQLYLNDTGLRSLAAEVFVGMPDLEELHLEGNGLMELHRGTFHGLTGLDFLDVSSNALVSIEEGVFRPLASLKELRLNHNHLVSFPIWTLSEDIPRLSKLSISENPWKCDCEYVDNYRKWLQNYAHIVSDPEKLFCQTTDNGTSLIPLIAFNSSHCFNSSSGVSWKMGNKNTYFPLLVGLLSTLVTLSLLSILIYAYRKEMQVLVYSRYGVRLFHAADNDDDDGEAKTFDAFVSYSSLDETFIVQEFLPKLEGLAEPTYKLCLHHRNFLAGGFIMDSIIEAIKKSRRTILLLSDNFMKSEWCRFEFKSAHLQMLEDRRNRVILVILGKIPDQLDPEMKLYMKTNTYLEWGDRLFWEKLYFALPDVQKPAP